MATVAAVAIKPPRRTAASRRQSGLNCIVTSFRPPAGLWLNAGGAIFLWTLYHFSRMPAISSAEVMECASLNAAAIDGAELNGILTQYLAVERLRVFRHLLVRRFGLFIIAVLVAGVAFRWLSLVATLGSVAALLVPPTGAWIVERRHARALAWRLDRAKDIKSS